MPFTEYQGSGFFLGSTRERLKSMDSGPAPVQLGHTLWGEV
jgi:hypothetical protein